MEDRKETFVDEERVEWREKGKKRESWVFVPPRRLDPTLGSVFSPHGRPAGRMDVLGQKRDVIPTGAVGVADGTGSRALTG